MLKREASNQTELLEIMQAIEVLGFTYTVNAVATNGVFSYSIVLGETNETGAQVLPQSRSNYRKRTNEVIKEENALVLDFLKNAGRAKTAKQIAEYMVLKGAKWNPNSVTGIIQLAMAEYPEIKRVNYGFYQYKQD